MQIPVPSKINTSLAVFFVVALFVVQQVEGTDLVFSALCALFLAAFVVAFNLCKGLLYPSGAWVFFFAVGAVIIGLVGKAFVGEPAQTNLMEPNKTMLVFAMSMVVIGPAAVLGHRLAPRKALLVDLVKGEDMHLASIGCLAIGTFLSFGPTLVPGVFGSGSGSLGSALGQLNQFPKMAIILGTYYAVQSSGGRKSADWVVYCAGGLQVLVGIIGYSKEGLFFPFVSWFLTAMVAGANFTRKQFVLGALLMFFMIHYMVPFSQYGRRSRGEAESLSGQTKLAFTYLLDLEGTRKAYLAIDEGSNDAYLLGNHYFNSSKGLLDREQMISTDDELIAFTDQGNVYGLFPVYAAYLNIVPRFIWHGKVTFGAGNQYAREVGIIDAEDESTGISFSPVGDAYHEATWFGILLVLPLVIFVYSYMNDTFVGSVKDSPWALLPIAISTEIAPQGLLNGTIYLSTYTIGAVTIIALLSKYLIPQVTRIFVGREVVRADRRLTFRAGPTRPSLLEPLVTPADETATNV